MSTRSALLRKAVECLNRSDSEAHRSAVRDIVAQAFDLNDQERHQFEIAYLDAASNLWECAQKCENDDEKKPLVDQLWNICQEGVKQVDLLKPLAKYDQNSCDYSRIKGDLLRFQADITVDIKKKIELCDQSFMEVITTNEKCKMSLKSGNPHRMHMMLRLLDFLWNTYGSIDEKFKHEALKLAENFRGVLTWDRDIDPCDNEYAIFQAHHDQLERQLKVYQDGCDAIMERRKQAKMLEKAAEVAVVLESAEKEKERKRNLRQKFRDQLKELQALTS